MVLPGLFGLAIIRRCAGGRASSPASNPVGDTASTAREAALALGNLSRGSRPPAKKRTPSDSVLTGTRIYSK